MPTWKELKRFCENDEWELYKQTDHFFYRKIDSMGNVKQTKISMGTGEIPKILFKKILKNQLGVDLSYFNKKC